MHMPLSPLSLLPKLLFSRLLTVMTNFSIRVSHTVLLWFWVMVMMRFLSPAPVFRAFLPPPPLLLFALNLPCSLAALANALLGMVNSDLLLLLQLRPHRPPIFCIAKQITSISLLCTSCSLHFPKLLQIIKDDLKACLVFYHC
jgi:hypothetical protein